MTGTSSPDTVALRRLSDPGVLRVVTVAAFALLVVLAWTRNVHWDEFFFLSHVHAHLDGRLDRPLQTAFVHAFGWLAAVPGNEMGQIFVGRLVMTALLATTAVSIFRIAATLTDARAAAVAVVGFVTSGFVLAHGSDFRADPIAAAALTGALGVMIASRMSVVQVVGLAILSAVALLVTIKSALYLPAFLGALYWRGADRVVAARILVAGVLGLLLAGILFALHAAGIEAPPGRDAATNARDAFRTTLLQDGYLARWREAVRWALLSIGGLTLAVLGLSGAGAPRLRVLVVSFAMPLFLSIIFYRNAFPYFFPFIVPPLMVVAAVGAARLGPGRALGGLLLLMIVTGMAQAGQALAQGAELQRATLAEVHRLFPEPVPYIDANAMVSTFPHEGFFMSTWGVMRYRARGRPIMSDIIRQAEPPLLLANRWALRQAMTDPGAPDHPLLLMPEDQAALRRTYVHYSGIIWLAGRSVVLGPDPETVDLPFPGRYRLEIGVPVSIDGRRAADGDVIEVTHAVYVSGPAGTELTLVWYTGQEPRPKALPRGSVYPTW